MPKGIAPKELPIEVNLNTSNNKNNTNTKICNSHQKQMINNLKIDHNKLENIDNNINTLINSEKENRAIDKKFKEFLTTYEQNENSIYPKLNGMSEGDTKN